MEHKGRRSGKARARTELQLYREQLRANQLERRTKLVELQEAKLEEAREQRALQRASARAALEAAAEHAEAPPVRMEFHDPERSGLWSGLAVGLGVAALVGVAGVIVYLLVRKRDGQVVGQVLPQGLAAPQPQHMLTAGGSGPSGAMALPGELTGTLDTIARALAPRSSPYGGGDAIMKSWNLPSLNDKTRGAIKVAQATDVPYEVVLRTVGPAATWAAFAYQATELNMAPSNIPIGDTIIIPAMQWQVIRLKPRQQLFAKGSQANVVISVTSTELPDGLGRYAVP